MLIKKISVSTLSIIPCLLWKTVMIGILIKLFKSKEGKTKGKIIKGGPLMWKIGFYISAQKYNYIFAQLKITYLRKIITYLRRNYISAQNNYISAQKLHICAKITYLRITTFFQSSHTNFSLFTFCNLRWNLQFGQRYSWLQ